VARRGKAKLAAGASLLLPTPGRILVPQQFVSACNEISSMCYLSPLCSVTIPLHVSGLLVAYHQDVTLHMRQLVRVVRLSSLSARLVDLV
jgi:hypothetical protein